MRHVRKNLNTQTATNRQLNTLATLGNHLTSEEDMAKSKKKSRQAGDKSAAYVGLQNRFRLLESPTSHNSTGLQRLARHPLDFIHPRLKGVGSRPGVHNSEPSINQIGICDLERSCIASPSMENTRKRNNLSPSPTGLPRGTTVSKRQ